MTNKYILKGHKAVPCDDLLTWGRWLDRADRIVRKDKVDGVGVSTVFLGLNHNYGDGPPLLFETMIFGGPHDQYQERCETWEEAEAMHEVALKIATGTVDQTEAQDEFTEPPVWP